MLATLEAFAQATAKQVQTVITTTKTAAIVIFACGALAGCVLGH